MEESQKIIAFGARKFGGIAAGRAEFVRREGIAVFLAEAWVHGVDWLGCPKRVVRSGEKLAGILSLLVSG